MQVEELKQTLPPATVQPASLQSVGKKEKKKKRE